MTYEAIILPLEDWSRNRGITILKEDSPIERRYFYISSSNGETFQIVVEPERGGIVRIDAHLIEGQDNVEVHYMWEVPIANFQDILEISAGSIENWFARKS